MSRSNGNGRAHLDGSGGLLLAERGLEFEPVSIAVVGLGYWGPNLARNLQECPHARLAALCDLSGERLQRVGRRYPGARCYQSLEMLLDDPEIEAVAVATPVSTHHRIASAALNAGKHVFVEKPLAASSKEGQELAEIAGHRWKFHPCRPAPRRQIGRANPAPLKPYQHLSGAGFRRRHAIDPTDAGRRQHRSSHAPATCLCDQDLLA